MRETDVSDCFTRIAEKYDRQLFMGKYIFKILKTSVVCTTFNGRFNKGAISQLSVNINVGISLENIGL